ncbi:uncharacterized protein HKW66_Vig0103390 [Vigna angularis]|uniref:Secreted protein n=2 Tax=Phaseolus angularis TaxID=3914 RepID=A0A8T0KKM0_PHAAN|nr:uncharacterized protein HKW66_Vig0103390 [Vigna angularis]BAT78684.1 hypothetical protein VIGAN_02139800 [Vigna angularis var. angularis]
MCQNQQGGPSFIQSTRICVLLSLAFFTEILQPWAPTPNCCSCHGRELHFFQLHCSCCFPFQSQAHLFLLPT